MGKRGPKKEDGVGRVRLGGCGHKVSYKTDKGMRLMREMHGIPFGRLIDACFNFAMSKPEFSIKLNFRKFKPKPKEDNAIEEREILE